MLDNWLQTEKDNAPWMGIMYTSHVKVERKKIVDYLSINKDNVEDYANLTQLSHDAIVRKIKPVKLKHFLQ